MRLPSRGNSVANVTDTLGNTYTQILQNHGTGISQALYYAKNIQSGINNIVKATFAQGAERRMSPEEIERIRTWQRETTNVRKDGTRFPVHLMSDVVRHAAGEAIAVVD